MLKTAIVSPISHPTQGYLMTPTLLQYATFAQTFAQRNAVLIPLHIYGKDNGTSVEAVFRIGNSNGKKYYDMTYLFTTPLDIACIRMMNKGVAEVQDDIDMIMQEQYSDSLAAFHNVNPYDGSEAQQEQTLMDRKCGADRQDYSRPSDDWRMELHYDYNQYLRNMK